MTCPINRTPDRMTRLEGVALPHLYNNFYYNKNLEKVLNGHE
jgi:hypothetical protein